MKDFRQFIVKLSGDIPPAQLEELKKQINQVANLTLNEGSPVEVQQILQTRLVLTVRQWVASLLAVLAACLSASNLM